MQTDFLGRRSYLALPQEAADAKRCRGRFAPGYNATDHPLVARREAPHNQRIQQTIPPANKFASGLAPDPQRSARRNQSSQKRRKI